jgi:pseudouridine-5'-phosphate glycosidase
VHVETLVTVEVILEPTGGIGGQLPGAEVAFNLAAGLGRQTQTAGDAVIVGADFQLVDLTAA